MGRFLIEALLLLNFWPSPQCVWIVFWYDEQSVTANFVELGLIDDSWIIFDCFSQSKRHGAAACISYERSDYAVKMSQASKRCALDCHTRHSIPLGSARFSFLTAVCRRLQVEGLFCLFGCCFLLSGSFDFAL